MARKMILVPEAEFRRLKQSELNVTSASTILEDVKHPNEQEMVKTYMGMEKMLQDPSKPDQQQVAEHVERMNAFGVLKNRVIGTRDFKRDVMSKEPNVDTDTVIAETVELMPVTLQKQARQLLERLSKIKDFISWSASGEVTIGGGEVDWEQHWGFGWRCFTLEKNAHSRASTFSQCTCKGKRTR